MVKAIWNNTVIAASDNTIVVEGNHYFPIIDVNTGYLQASDTTTYCGWKGDAGYYHVVIDDQRNENAAWYYAEPKTAADNIRGYIAFWRGIEVG